MRKIISMGIFILLGGILFAYGQKILIPKWNDAETWYSSDIVEGFYAEKRDSLDLLFMGSSQFMSGISPMELYKRHGIASYSLALDSQDTVLSYYWLREACKYQSPEVLAFECQMLFQDTPSVFYHRKNLDYMKFSFDKLKAIKELCSHSPNENMSDYLFPALYYHTRYQELTKEDFTEPFKKKECPYKGFVFLNGQVKMQYQGIVCDSEDAEEISAYKLKWMQKILAYCKKKKIDIVLVKTPRVGDWTAKRHAAVEKLAEEHDIPFLDFNEKLLYREAGFQDYVDFAEAYHMNMFGALKLSICLGKYFDMAFTLPDRRKNPEYAAWDKDLRRYEREYQHYERTVCKDFYRCLDFLTKKDDLNQYRAG